MNEEENNIHVDRIRYFLDFQNPFAINCVEEFTLFNSGSTLDHINYDIRFFRPHLNVYDSTQEKLEFHSLDPNNPELTSTKSICIDFPRSNQFFSRDYRTIRLEHSLGILDYQNKKRKRFLIPLHSSETGYMNIKLNDDFDIDFICSIEFKPRRRRRRIIDLTPYFKDNKIEIDLFNTSVKIKKEFAHVDIWYKGKFEGYATLRLDFTAKIAERNKIWYDLGGALGVVSAITIMLLLKENNWSNSNTQYIIAIGGTALTYMIVTKGWLFMKGMERAFDTPYFSGRYFTYNRIYIGIILVLIAELLVLFLEISCYGETLINLLFNLN